MQATVPALESTPAVLGLVLTLAADAPELGATLTTLWESPGLKLDEQRGPFLALSAETEDPRALHRWLESLPGVQAVDVVFVEVLAEGAAHGSRRARHHQREAGEDFLIPAPTENQNPVDPSFLQP